MVERLESSVVVAGGIRRACADADDPAGDRTYEPQSTWATADEVFALVYRQVRKLAAGRDVDDLVQAAAEQALASLPTFAGRSALSTWTFRICYVTIRKHDRWYRRWLRRFTLTEDGETPEVATEAETGADELLERAQRAARLRAGLALMSPMRRAVIVLHDFEGFSVEEIAKIVGATPAAVRSRLRDGRKALAETLASDPYFGFEACGGGRGGP